MVSLVSARSETDNWIIALLWRAPREKANVCTGPPDVSRIANNISWITSIRRVGQFRLVEAACSIITFLTDDVFVTHSWIMDEPRIRPLPVRDCDKPVGIVSPTATFSRPDRRVAH
ncbi:MAG: hypothetical protein CTY20_10345 [Hyphomicrobium sp.]|nr:MAG: hypothetical protein CTY20_10345 [Hyphomicrobium sp.]